ncbi:MAG: ATP-binding protein [Deltaproteobacteria bacterium]|nr:ATP-binding protein [Deltaproteobacteria bacterium]
MDWGFYGRRTELERLRGIVERGRWFFCKLSGRRRIGKTTLIQQALGASDRVFYVQVPDSGPAGILSAARDAFETFGIDQRRFSLPGTLSELANSIGDLAKAGYVVVLDEFQYFNRKHLYEFTSHLQRVVDRLSARAARVRGGLFVLGSLHTELAALLEDRRAPLYNRVTDTIEVDHLDVGSVLEILRAHADPSPERLLMLWNLFEGVPKFYRDCFEQGALGADRHELIRRMFLQSSAPLRTEADNWFLHELRGRYDVVLKFVARNPGCTNGDIEQHVRTVSPETIEQAGGYLKVLSEKYRMIERKLPIFAERKERKGRYYIRDNFLRSWLGALAPAVAAINFRPVDVLVAQADERLAIAEGHALERLVAALYEERSRKGLPGFALTRRVEGYWDARGTEIDLVAVDDEQRIIRFGTCRRSPSKLAASMATSEQHIQRFLAQQPAYANYAIERVAIAPEIDPILAAQLTAGGFIAEDLRTLTRELG